MNKRDFIKSMCTMGACSCAIPFVGGIVNARSASESDECEEVEKMNKSLEGRLNHGKNQLGLLLHKIESEIPAKRREEILIEMGRNCASATKWGDKFVGDLDGFLEYMNKKGGNEKIIINDSKTKITLISTERDYCGCPIIEKSKTPSYYCSCSLGWQQYTYEVVTGKKVEVKLLESVLLGGKHCSFEINIVS